MQSKHLSILPVYSEYLDPPFSIGSVRLLKHQVETWEAIRNPDVDVVFNTAMTGDGKSLAAYLSALIDEKSVIAMYPTNELIRDQFYAMPNYQQRLNVRLARYGQMYSDEITRLMRMNNTLVRMEEVRKLLVRNPMLLTNPDLTHLIMSYQYGWDHLRKELPITLAANFDYFLFDEFHVFGIPQVIAVMNMVGYLATYYRGRPQDHKKFVFLSATPSKLMNRLLERGGLSYRKIEGNYCSSEQPGYRCILQPCELELHEVSQDCPTEVWVEEHIDDIRDFFQAHKDSKGAILVYSVATARRLVMLLKERLEIPYGITIGENTGLTNPDERLASFQKHILVGTSTVDIGVDFHINYLIFEAYNGGSFLQRFGRLGRHDEFDEYRAYALVPRFVLERMMTKMVSVEEVEREYFNEVVREAFPTEQEYENYTRRWGVVQAAQIPFELQEQKGKDANQTFTDALIEQYERFYGSADKPVMAKAIKKYWRLQQPGGLPEVLRELQSFRGQSPLSCGVWDTDDYLKTYDLFFLLANTEFEVLDEEEFMQEVRKRGKEEQDFKDQLLYFKIHAYVPERMQLILGLTYDLGANAHVLHNAYELKGFHVLEPRHTWLDKVNRKLKGQKLVCTISDMPRMELRQRLPLGAMFPLNRLQDVTGYEYTVAFGQEALLLDSLLFFRKTKEDKAIQA